MSSVRRRPVDWALPAHKPIERKRARLGDGFVLIGGWQRRYLPEPQHRRHVIVEARTARVARLRALAERKCCPPKRRAKLLRKARAVGK